MTVIDYGPHVRICKSYCLREIVYLPNSDINIKFGTSMHLIKELKLLINKILRDSWDCLQLQILILILCVRR